MPQFTTRKAENKVKVTFSNGLLFVEKEDGKQQAFPLDWYPKLLNATDAEREDWEQKGSIIHWSKLNIDISF